MTIARKPVTILLADDDPASCRLTKEALQECGLFNELRFVHEGGALLDYLFQRGKFGAPGTAPRPGLIMLDLNMPQMNGMEALARIKGDPGLRRIPVIILTTSQSETDINRSYDLGANSFITKPLNFDELVEVMRGVGRYWFEVMQLPTEYSPTI